MAQAREKVNYFGRKKQDNEEIVNKGNLDTRGDGHPFHVQLTEDRELSLSIACIP